MEILFSFSLAKINKPLQITNSTVSIITSEHFAFNLYRKFRIGAGEPGKVFTIGKFEANFKEHFIKFDPVTSQLSLFRIVKSWGSDIGKLRSQLLLYCVLHGSVSRYSRLTLSFSIFSCSASVEIKSAQIVIYGRLLVALLPLVRLSIWHCFLRNSQHKSRLNPNACMLHVKLLSRIGKSKSETSALNV